MIGDYHAINYVNAVVCLDLLAVIPICVLVAVDEIFLRYSMTDDYHIMQSNYFNA